MSEQVTQRGLFKVATMDQAYLKAGFFGSAGSGKTHTSALLAKGLSERIGKKAPVYFLDTESGAGYIVPLFQEWGIPLLTNKTRSFIDLIDGVVQAEKDKAILIVDSVSHFWQELQDSYKKEKRQERIEFQGWGAIKGTWARFSTAFLNASTHIIICGRVAGVYEFQERDDGSGKKDLIKTGDRMKAEGDFGFEPSLLVEMDREPKEGDLRKHGQLYDHCAYVLKDRTRTIHGKRFVNPDFSCFAPVLDFLSIGGGKHEGVNVFKDSTALFKKEDSENFYQRRHRVEVLKEEIAGELTSAFPGRTTEEQKIKTDLLQEAFATRSWAALDEFAPEILQEGLDALKKLIAARKTKEPGANGKKK